PEEDPCTPKPVSRARTEIGQAEIEKFVELGIVDDERSVQVGFTDRQIRIQGHMPRDGPVGDADGDQWLAGAEVIAAAIRRDDGQRTLSDDATKLVLQQEHARTRPQLSSCRAARRLVATSGL